MKRSAIVTITTASLLSLLTPPSVFANVSVHVSDNGEASSSNVSVHQEGSSQTTTCANGVCTSTGSEGKTTVCHNGDCKTYDGDVNYESENGHTKVQINNSNTITITPRPTEGEDTNEAETGEPEHHFMKRNPEPTSSSAQLKVHKKVAGVRSELKKMMKEQNGGLSDFFISLQKFLKSMFH